MTPKERSFVREQVKAAYMEGWRDALSADPASGWEESLARHAQDHPKQAQEEANSEAVASEPT